MGLRLLLLLDLRAVFSHPRLLAAGLAAVDRLIWGGHGPLVKGLSAAIAAGWGCAHSLVCASRHRESIGMKPTGEGFKKAACSQIQIAAYP
jgi:hypothetical protein